MKHLKNIALVLCSLLLATSAHAKDGRNLLVKQNSSAGKRIALVIGNGNYQYPDILPKLPNPPHDAEDIAAALRAFGFDVIERKNQTKEEMDAAISEFGRKIANSEAALFYFAGHGLQVKGQNYLIPVDAKIESESQVPYKSINVNQLLDEMDNAKSSANIVMLDACRNNPISGKFRSGATRGLAAPSSQPKGTVIVYATDPGNVAADGDGRNGLFTAGLLTAFKGSDLSLHGVLVRASAEVERGSQQKQTPYINGPATLQENFHFGLGTQAASLEPVPAPVTAPVGGSFSLDDIKKQQEGRAQWEKWQAGMKADFEQTAAFTGAPELQVTAWERFLSNYAQDNPYSAEDKQLRAQAQSKKQAAQAQQQQAATKLQQQKQEASHPVKNNTIQQAGSNSQLPALPAGNQWNTEITGAGENQIPIAIVPFAGEERFAPSINQVVSADLERSGLFRLVDPAGKMPHEPREVVYADWSGVDALAIGGVEEQPNGRVAVKFRLIDANRKTELAGQAIAGKADQLRAIAHRTADIIYEKLTGKAGIFSTRIAYVNKQGKVNRLVVADSDGYGRQTALSINAPIMSPSWSPDGSHLAYVSFEKGHATVYVQSLLTNMRKVAADYPGSNSVPAWSPDGRQLAIVLTRDGGSHIYLVRADGSDLRQITFGNANDNEPNFSPDGQSLIFASDRGGSVQIYRMAVNGDGVERLTSEGGGNFTPRYSPDGKSFVFSHLSDGRFYIATEDFNTRQMQVLTDGGIEKTPSYSPNGKLILFATEVNGQRLLATVSIDGRVKQKLFPQAGEELEPMWGPFLK